MIEDDETLIESMRLALQAQQEIKQQLLAELAQLESKSQTTKFTEKSLKFYQSSLNHTEQEKNSINEQIIKFKNTVLPEIQQQLDRIQQKRHSLDEQISNLQKYRDSGLMESIQNPSLRSERIATFQENLQKEIDMLIHREKELEDSTCKAKLELHVLQEQYLNSQRESAKKQWENELANECGLNRQHLLRRRSHTVSMTRKLQPYVSVKKGSDATKKRVYHEF